MKNSYTKLRHRHVVLPILAILFLLIFLFVAVLKNGIGNNNGNKVTSSTDWNLRLVNASHPLSSDFSIETHKLENGLYFDSRAYDKLNQMLTDGNKQGLSLMVCSAYRTIDKQTKLFNQEIAKQEGTGLPHQKAYDTAQTVVAIPGTSEHNLGLAADICAADHQELDDAYADTAEAKWLKENAADYGFVLRYPNDKQKITGVIFEPWHYRYVGKENARKMNELHMCLEEYVNYLKKK